MKEKTSSHFLLVALLIGGVFVYGQQAGYYLDETETRLPENLQISVAAAMGDVDLDGDLDILVANFYTTLRPGQNRLLINDGSGYFTDESELRLLLRDDATFDIALLDIDGDGDLDYMAANTYAGGAPSGNNALYLNDGTGHFEDVSSERIPQDDEGTVAIAFADVDGDLDLDVFWASYLGTRLLLNDGAGYFTDVSSTHLEPDTLGGLDVVFGDVDGDGDVDLLIAGFDLLDGKPNYLYINDGTGHFIEEGTSRLPEINDGSLESKTCTFGDIDGDGDLDIVFANVLTLVLLVNDGSGYYTDVSEKQLPGIVNVHGWDAQFLDADLDGDPDIFISTSSGAPAQNLLYLNDGSGYFTDATESWLPQQTESSNRIAFGDVDGDEDIDIFLPCDGFLQNHLLINYLNTVGVQIETTHTPEQFILLPNYPNPFNSSTTIRYTVADEESRITLSIYDLLGQRVVTLVDKRQTGGVYEVTWDGKNNQGRSVSAGMYLYRITAISLVNDIKFQQTRKMVLLR